MVTGPFAVDVHLAQLRQKLPALTITTIRGFGFRLEEPAAGAGGRPA